jgi:hypothetical protein
MGVVLITVTTREVVGPTSVELLSAAGSIARQSSSLAHATISATAPPRAREFEAKLSINGTDQPPYINPSNSPDQSNHQLSSESKAAIALGAVVGISFLVGIILLLLRRRRSMAIPDQTPEENRPLEFHSESVTPELSTTGTVLEVEDTSRDRV